MSSNTRPYSNEFLFSVSQLFNVPQVLKLTDRKHKDYVSKVLSNTPTGRKKKFTVANTYDWFYKILLEHYRCEYVYKNEIARQLLMEKHSERDARLFTEVDVHKSKADVLIVNGTSSVYEIKTELDDFERLDGQLESYMLVFDRVFVVTHPSMIATVKKRVAQSIGIMTLCDDGTIATIRRATSNKERLSPQHMFHLLHKAEYMQIILDHFGHMPAARPVEIFNVYKNLFCEIPPAQAHGYMVKALKKRAAPIFRTELLDALPPSLKLIAATPRLNKQECEVINSCLEVYLPVSTNRRNFATK